MFDETASWYSPQTTKWSTSEEGDSENGERAGGPIEIDLESLEESPTSLRLSRPEGWKSYCDETHGDEFGATSWPTKSRHNKGKEKMPEYDSEKLTGSDSEPQEIRSVAARRTLKSTNEKLRDRRAKRIPLRDTGRMSTWCIIMRS